MITRQIRNSVSPEILGGNKKSCLKNNLHGQMKSGKQVSFAVKEDTAYEAKIALRELLALKRNVLSLNSPSGLMLYQRAVCAEKAAIIGTKHLETITDGNIRQQQAQSIDICHQYAVLSKCVLKLAIFRHKSLNAPDYECRMRNSRKFEIAKNNMFNLVKEDKDLMDCLIYSKTVMSPQRYAFPDIPLIRNEFLPARVMAC